MIVVQRIRVIALPVLRLLRLPVWLFLEPVDVPDGAVLITRDHHKLYPSFAQPDLD